MNSTDSPAGGPDAVYQHYLAQGQLRIQQCQACSRHVFYPRVLCPHCGASALRWVQVSGKGSVYACSLVMGKPGTASDYAIVLVDLQEGVRLMGRVHDYPQDRVHIGMQVRARVVRQDDRPLVVFVAQGGEQ